MSCDKCLTGERHGTQGQVTFTVTLTTVLLAALIQHCCWKS